MSSNSGMNKPAWVQLYEARRMEMEVEPRSPGRPPAPIPRRKVGFTLSQGEIRELDAWQERFSRLLNRKLSTGETIGILTRICTARFSRLTDKAEKAHELSDLENLSALVERMIGE